MTDRFDPALDLFFERTVDVPPEFVWRAWTEPELLMQWFTPAPWTTPDCTIELRPGGRFSNVMRSPDGVEMRNEGCYLEIVPNRKLVWTSALLGGYRPKPHEPNKPFVFTATIALEPTSSGGTRYTATLMHAEPGQREKHDKMGFHHGWGTALDQLVALAR